jgi:hypothetical protein
MSRNEHVSSGHFAAAEEDTASGVPLSSLPPLAEDPDEALGQLMAALARQGRHISLLKRDVGTIRTEVTGLRKDTELDRGELVDGASRKAAKHSSNRMAALMGALFTLYEVSSPYLHELVRLVRHHG